MTLTLANEKDRNRYWGLAQQWADQKSWSFTSEQDKYVSLQAVSEYLANQNAETVFMSNIGEEYESK